MTGCAGKYNLCESPYNQVTDCRFFCGAVKKAVLTATPTTMELGNNSGGSLMGAAEFPIAVGVFSI